VRGLDFAYAYIDHLLISSSSPEEHLKHLRAVPQQLEEHGILINVQNTKFGVSELDFLRFHLDATGICPLQEKVEVVREFFIPNTQRHLRRFLGLVNFYHRFIPRGATLLQPLHTLLKHAKRLSDIPE